MTNSQSRVIDPFGRYETNRILADTFSLATDLVYTNAEYAQRSSFGLRVDHQYHQTGMVC